MVPIQACNQLLNCYYFSPCDDKPHTNLLLQIKCAAEKLQQSVTKIFAANDHFSFFCSEEFLFGKMDKNVELVCFPRIFLGNNWMWQLLSQKRWNQKRKQHWIACNFRTFKDYCCSMKASVCEKTVTTLMRHKYDWRITFEFEFNMLFYIPWLSFSSFEMSLKWKSVRTFPEIFELFIGRMNERKS